MHFNIKRPCAKCPFRKDIIAYLSPERAKEISDSLLEGKTFPCHETIDYTNTDDNGNPIYKLEETSHCAGALVMIKKNDVAHQMTQIAERFGLYDPSKIDMESPVYETFDAFIEACRDSY